MSTPPSAVIADRLRSAGCVFAEEEADLLLAAAHSPGELADMLERRVAGLPLEPIVGWAEFCGLRIAVEPGVFVPRRRTAFLVRLAADLLGVPARRAAPAQVVDLCCGSGAIGAALIAARPALEVHATDVDPVAVGCARRNLGARGRAYEGDLYEPLPPALRERVDVLVANPPHVPTDAIALLPPEARIHEPLIALHGGADGLDVVRRVAAAAPEWLAPGGHLLIETGARQATIAAGILDRRGLETQVAHSPGQEATVVVGARP